MSTNTDIFNFKFVDRDISKDIIENFIQSSENFLWIDGMHGVGKSFFLERYTIPYMKKHFEYVIYINKSSNESNINYLSLLLEEMTKDLPTPFEKYICDHYTSLINTSEKINSSIKDIKFFKGISSFISILLNASNLFLNKNEEPSSPAKVVSEYIEDATLNYSACFIFDNFSYCDQESFQIFEEIFLRIRKIKNLRFILCTTTEERNDSINILLCEKLPHIYLSLEKFNNPKYFEDILVNKFHMTNWLYDNISNIFYLCDGIPDNLRSFIRTLYINKGIKYEEDKFLVLQDKASELLFNNSIDFDPENLTPGQRLIVQIVAFWGRPMSYKLLLDFIQFMNQENDENSFLFKMLHDRIDEIIEQLLQECILSIQFFNNAEQLTFKHDNLFNSLYHYYHDKNNATNAAFIHHFLYLYLKSKETIVYQYGFSELDILELFANQSYNAFEDDWYIYNEELAKYYYNKKQLYRCNQILSQIRNRKHAINIELQLIMADVFYEIAEYQSCIQSLDTLDISKLTNEEKYKYYLLYGKAVSFQNSTIAAQFFEKGLQLNITDNQRITLQYYCEMSYSEIASRSQDAQDLFEKLYNNTECKRNSLYPSVLRTAVNIYSVKDSFAYLEEALDISRKNNYLLEEAKILNNLGFLYTRIEDYDSASKYFKESCSKLENTKPFEMSYPLTNLVFIHMVKKEWDKAMDRIETATIYNKTNFLPNVLLVYKMICLVNQDRIEDSLEIKGKVLDSIIEGKIVDYKMVKKSKINCAYIAYKIGDIESMEILMNEVWNLVKDTAAQARFLNLCHKWNVETPFNISASMVCDFDIYDQIDFEPWVVTFGHD